MGKVREKKMGMLFENMEKMDIQEERRKTAEQRRRAEEAEQKVEEAEQRLESIVRLFVENCQELGVSKETIMSKIQEKHQMSSDEVWKIVEEYWKKE